ncbi:MAG TPA: hypothetical protein VEO02_08525 [Thermoanaerobaculia bacterium]|nr:hypothetical protein [Thermoanaerobaculia bacterium]
MILKHKESGTVEFASPLRPPTWWGSWDGWSLPGIPVVRQQSEAPAWKAVVQLSPGEHQFRFRIGSHWFNDPSADRYVDNGLGGDNSVVIVEEPPKKAGRRSSPRRTATKRRS